MRRKKAWDMKILGYNLSEIALATGVNVSTSCRDVEHAYQIWREEIQNTTIEKLANITLKQLYEIIKAFLPKAREGDEKAARVVHSTIDRIIRITGMEAPKKIEIMQQQSEEEVTEELQKLLNYEDIKA